MTMRLACLLLSASFASGQALRLLPGFQSGGLVPRQLVGDGSDCSIYDTCGECFGTGYVLCDNAGCFNPDDGEQCCEGGSMCVGFNSSCCINGPGTAGEDGAIDYDSLEDEDEDDEDEDEDEDSSTSWLCDITMTDEECCVAGGENIHWCPGDVSGGLCMNSTEMICCEDGHVCDTEDCCDIVDSTPVTPWETSSSAQSTPEPSSSNSSDSNSDFESESDNSSHSETGLSTATTTPSATSPSVDSSSPTPTDAGVKLSVAQGVSALAGALVAGFLAF
ncbi:hypothetical protein BJY01DRAFT_171102 [Aspergillus pseudoustus]|uniref:GPI anchored protein n=1 Tax=Aspergillus pseudoustus TaxID=1810923 RepID=A0ABR4KWH6_9EURO